MLKKSKLMMLVVVLFLKSTVSLAGFKPGSHKRQSFKQEAMDYKSCRKDVLKRTKGGSGAKQGLARCKEKFPGGSIAIECKRKALKQHKKNPKRMKKALQACKQSQKQVAFKPKSNLPFVIAQNQLYFAGVGLNLPLKFSGSRFGNYSCEQLENYLNTGKNPDYLLFGNNPKAFSAFEKMPLNKVLRVIGVKPQGQKGGFQTSKVFGKVYDWDKPAKVASYFPINYCNFARKMGPLYDGIKIYYLSQRASKFVAPYFGIAFYSPNAAVQAGPLAKKVAAALGKGYKVQVQKKDFIYIAKKPFKVFDAEGDPYNVCLKPRGHEYIALIRKRANGAKPEYLAVANIKNLCRYGDRLSNRLAR